MPSWGSAFPEKRLREEGKSRKSRRDTNPRNAGFHGAPQGALECCGHAAALHLSNICDR